MFYATAHKYPERNALLIERGGAKFVWTYKQYFDDVINFSKALTKIGVTERSAVAIMGFNSPEWVISCMGSIMNNCITTGIYTTNEPEACTYQLNHAGAECVVVQTADHLRRIMTNIDQQPNLKQIVCYGEAKIPDEYNDPRIILWTDFLKLGQADVPSDHILTRMRKQNAGNCCMFIYTSGTTGPPKGCMISHDNLCWNAIATVDNVYESRPDLRGPENRLVSFLPLSHIAGFAFDVMI
jgi:long-subunit acyl-CoA synthetase (AMP-forming)